MKEKNLDTDVYCLGEKRNQSPISIIDIGSNSIRIVIYENATRSASVLFNQRIFAGLGKDIYSTGKLNPSGVACALEKFECFQIFSDQVGAKAYAFATAAVRVAQDSSNFILKAEEVLKIRIKILSGKEEAHYAACGVISGFHNPDGIIGDMGGGSLELIEICNAIPRKAQTLPLGGVNLKNMAHSCIRKAGEIIREELEKLDFLMKKGENKTFFAVGGSWRNLALLHMEEFNHPLNIAHHYEIKPENSIGFLEKIISGEINKFRKIPQNRQAFLQYGAIALLEIQKKMKPLNIIISEFGIREGFLYSLLSREEKEKDPLISAAMKIGRLHSCSVSYSNELIEWISNTLKFLEVNESVDQERYRKAVCFLSNIGWQAHKKYCVEQALSTIAHALLPGLSHAGKAFIMSVFLHRYKGKITKETPYKEILNLVSLEDEEQARFLARLFRIADLFSLSGWSSLPFLKWEKEDQNMLRLIIPKKYKNFNNEYLEKQILFLEEKTEKVIKIIYQ